MPTRRYGIDEALAALADLRDSCSTCALDRVDDPSFVEARAGDLRPGWYFAVARSAEQQLVALAALTVDAEDADVARVVVAAGVDAARDLDLDLTDVLLAILVGEPLP